MSKKTSNAADVVHIGKRSFWSGTVRTLCGLTFGKSGNTEQLFTWGKACPACKDAKKRGVRF